MAEASSSRAAAIDLENEEQHDKLEMLVWQACMQSDQPDTFWRQSELLALDAMEGKDVNILVTCINRLVGRCLFLPLEKDANGWKAIPHVIASSMRKMTDVERAIYIQLYHADEDGMWSKTIQTKIGIAPAEMQVALKKLEGKKLIKPFKSPNHPNKKYYILFHLHPSEDATGGLFYSDGVIDIALLETLMQWTEVYVHRKAWQIPRKASESGKRKLKDFEDPADPGILFGSKRRKGVKPWPAGYQDYAKAVDVAYYLNKAGVLFKDKIMEKEAQQVLDLLCYDGRIEEVNSGAGYRSLLRPLANPWAEAVEDVRNGYSEIPCGGCPASELCDESGPVNARTCEYFEEWL